MPNRSMVEVFDIVKGYHYLYNVGGEQFMCIAAKSAFRDGKISERERYILEDLINDEMQRYADCYIPKENNYKVEVHTALHSVIVDALKSRHYDTIRGLDVSKMAEEIIPSWWDSFYIKLKFFEVWGAWKR